MHPRSAFGKSKHEREGLANACKAAVSLRNRLSHAMASGRYLCASHALVTMDRWHEVTHAIRGHQWMLDIARNVKAAAHDQWRRTAALAWSVEPDMAPHPQETQALYVARLLLDFEWRVGARSEKPQPMLPQRTWAMFEPKHAPAASVDGATSIGSVL